MIHIGIGETALNNLLAILNVPPLAGGTVTCKAHEREIGQAIEALARKSCQEVFKSAYKHKERIATDLDKIQNLAHYPGGTANAPQTLPDSHGDGEKKKKLEKFDCTQSTGMPPPSRILHYCLSL